MENIIGRICKYNADIRKPNGLHIDIIKYCKIIGYDEEYFYTKITKDENTNFWQPTKYDPTDDIEFEHFDNDPLYLEWLDDKDIPIEAKYDIFYTEYKIGFDKNRFICWMPEESEKAIPLTQLALFE